MKIKTITAVLLLFTIPALCQDLPAGHPPIAGSKPSAKGPSQNTQISGKVLEVTNAASYTYLLVDTGKEKLWAAITQIVVKPGDQVIIDNAMEMPHFHSKALNREFDKVYFSGNIAVNGKAPSAPDEPQAPTSQLPKGHPSISGSDVPAKVDLSGIKKAKGGKTIQEIYASKSKLSGQEVTVRGKVIKYNENILGKNWLHLRDGTGATGNNDLLVTTATPAKVGDTVLATGSVVLNKDFGSNYKYDVMIDNAKVTVE